MLEDCVSSMPSVDLHDRGTFWVHRVATTMGGWNWLSDCLDQKVVSVTGVALARDHLASAGDGMMVGTSLGRVGR